MICREVGFPLLVLPVLFAACIDGRDSAPRLLEPEATTVPGQAATVPGQAAELAKGVTYYAGPLQCANDAIETNPGEWSFPARGGVAGGSAACLTAQVIPPGNAPSGGFVLWQICGDGVTTGRGVRAECISGAREWVTVPGENWTELTNGEHATRSHSTKACIDFAVTIGYRYLYSPFNPDESRGGEATVVASEPFDVTSDGNLEPPDGCPPE